MEMEENQKKEQFSRAFVSAISAQSGFDAFSPQVDHDSIDLIIKGRRFIGKRRNPQIEVQLKCTASNLGDENYLKFQLPIKNYNDLRGDNLLCPRYLFVLVVPNNSEEWLIHETNYSTIKHCCYYFCLMNHPDTLNEHNVTLNIPRKQKLTSISMLELLESASNEKFIGGIS